MEKNKGIIRVQKDKENPYVMMNKIFLEDSRLSFKAKGILAYLLSKPDNWQVRVSDLIKRSDDGETAVYSGIHELKKYGYLQKYPVRIDGKIHHWESIVFEIPTTPENLLVENQEIAVKSQFHEYDVPENLFVENQDVENQSLENQNLENQEHNNIDFKELKMGINNQSVSQPDQQEEEETGRQADIPLDETMIKKQVGYTALIQQHSSDLVNEIVLNILDMYYSPSGVKVGKNIKPQAIVHSVLGKLTHWHIQYVLERFKEIGQTIKNKKDYLQSMIYNSVLEMDAHYQNAIRTNQPAETQEEED